MGGLPPLFVPAAPIVHKLRSPLHFFCQPQGCWNVIKDNRRGGVIELFEDHHPGIFQQKLNLEA
jgi:hypothetical protein